MVTQTTSTASVGSIEAQSSDLVDQVLSQLEPMIARQRRAVAKHGCLRAISSTHLHVLYLLEGGDFVTGEVLVVDGGRILR